jgi:hypothetical protein
MSYLVHVRGTLYHVPGRDVQISHTMIRTIVYVHVYSVHALESKVDTAQNKFCNQGVVTRALTDVHRPGPADLDSLRFAKQ